MRQNSSFSHFRLWLHFQVILTLMVTFATLLLQAQEQEHQATSLGGYKADCTTVPCDAGKNFTCDVENKWCVCAQHPVSDHIFMYDNRHKACMPILSVEKDHFRHCQEEIPSIAVNVSGSPEFCASHHECHIAHGSVSISTNIRCNFTRCSCECLPAQLETGIELSGVGQDGNCVYLPINCTEADECVEKYGNFSICNANTSRCECEPEAKFYRGECEVPSSADCGDGDEECQPDVKLESTGEPNPDSADSNPKSDDGPKITPDGRSTTPLIILACVSTVCVAGLFTLSWVRQRKTSRRVNLRSLRRGQGLDLASSFSTSAFDNGPDSPDDDKSRL